MLQLGFRSVFSKLFVSVMMALVLFAVAMLFLTQLVHDNSSSIRSQVLASQILNQVDPFLHDLNAADNRLQSRFMLAVIKKSFDIFDESLQAKMGLYDARGNLLVQTDNSDLPRHLPKEPNWLVKALPVLSGTPIIHQARVYSNTGYILLYESRLPTHNPTFSAVLNLFTGTLLLLIIMAVVLWWIARSMTWRINQMSQQMSRLGEGDFSVRVAEGGNDEIANLAHGFNRAAHKIEQLINANNLLLAHASHELRTPITRIRLQVEMMNMLAMDLPTTSKANFDKRANAITRDLSALNDLVESILLVSRLDAGHALQQIESLDFYELIHQEVQHYPQAHLYGDALIMQGQPKLLTHLVRNLLNNANIHGLPPVAVFIYTINELAQAHVIPPELVAQYHQSALLCPDNQSASSERVDKDSQDDNSVDQTLQASSLNTDLVHATNQQDTSNDSPPLPVLNSSKAEDKTDKINKGLSKRLIKTKPPQNTAKYAVLAVVDHGSGIAEDKRQDIFSPFVRLKQEKKGSGLGLSLVSQITHAHKGQISTDIWQGKTRFLVVLPLHATGNLSNRQQQIPLS